MTDYVITILFDDSTDVLDLDLPGVELEAAEEFTAQLRSDIEHAKTIDAPLINVTMPDPSGPGLALDPRHVRSVDLEEAEPA